jgi:hypothetical protein
LLGVGRNRMGETVRDGEEGDRHYRVVSYGLAGRHFQV